MDNTNKLLELYNELDSLLRIRYKDTSRTNSVILRFCNDLSRSGNPALIRTGKKLNMVRTLRNTLIHDFDNNKDHLIEISDDVIEFLKEVVEMLRNPKTAKDIQTPIAKLYTIPDNGETLVIDVMKEMRKRGFTQVPVVNENNVLKGVFSSNVLFAYLVNNPNGKIENLLIKDIWDYLPIDSHFSETYEFISIKLNETEIDNIFASSYERNKKLVIAFVTRTGNPKESLLGIIVPGDIIKDK